MDHSEVLDYLLANTCNRSPINIQDAVSEYTFDLHCAELVITAKLVQTEPTLKYEIIDYRLA